MLLVNYYVSVSILRSQNIQVFMLNNSATFSFPFRDEETEIQKEKNHLLKVTMANLRKLELAKCAIRVHSLNQCTMHRNHMTDLCILVGVCVYIYANGNDKMARRMCGLSSWPHFSETTLNITSTK